MKYIFFVLLFVANATFGQRWLTQKGTGIYITDSTGIYITGNATTLRNYVITNFQVEDSADYNSTTIAPASSSISQIYKQDPSTIESIPSFPILSADKIAIIRANLPTPTDRDKSFFIAFDRTNNRLVIFTKKTIMYSVFTTSP